MSEPVRRIKAPIRLEYRVTAGRDLSRFLEAVVEGRLIGKRCPSCHKVYIPPRGACPTCAVRTTDEVPVADTGTVTTFCVVNVPYEGQTIKLPYVYAWVLLDGADIAFPHLVHGIEASEVRMGLRVKAEWAPPEERRPTLESIRWFCPT